MNTNNDHTLPKKKKKSSWLKAGLVGVVGAVMGYSYEPYSEIWIPCAAGDIEVS
jgi:hypothetical protein